MFKHQIVKGTVSTGGNLPSHPNAPRKASGSRHGTSSFVQGAHGARGRKVHSKAKAKGHAKRMLS
jgi:hypothetical protein